MKPLTLLHVFAILSLSTSLYSQSILYGVSGGDSGSVISINPTTGESIVIGMPIPGKGITGMDFDSNNRMIVTTNRRNGNPQVLEIALNDASVISVISDILIGGIPQAVADIAIQPGTDMMYAITASDFFGDPLLPNSLIKVDLSSGMTTVVRNALLPTGGGTGYISLAFAPNGVLYGLQSAGFGVTPNLITIDPNDGSILTTIPVSISEGVMGLGWDPINNRLIGSSCCFTGGAGTQLVEVDFGTGTMNIVGTFSTTRVHDLAFGPAPPPEVIPTLSEWGIIVLMLILLIGGIVAIRQRNNDLVTR